MSLISQSPNDNVERGVDNLQFLPREYYCTHNFCDNPFSIQRTTSSFTVSSDNKKIVKVHRSAGYTSGFPAALSLMSFCLLAQGFHNSGTVPNPQDLAPKHSGTVFGVMNGIGCIPGRKDRTRRHLLLLLLRSETEPKRARPPFVIIRLSILAMKFARGLFTTLFHFQISCSHGCVPQSILRLLFFHCLESLVAD